MVSLRKRNPVSCQYVEIAGMLFLRNRVNVVRRAGREFGVVLGLSDFRVIDGDLRVDGMVPEEWMHAMLMD